jgi:hypothetical protein
MADIQPDSSSNPIKDQQFDREKPLYIRGGVTGEPERYLAEKPYDLSKFEFGVLRKGKFVPHIWVELIAGATVGMSLSIIGKIVVSALIGQRTPTVESWEFPAIAVGLLIVALLKFFRRKSDDEKDFDAIRDAIEQHFASNPPRRLHLTSKENGEQ